MPFDHLVLPPPREPAAPALDAGFVADLLAGLPADLAARFDARLLFAVQQAVAPWDGAERRRGYHLRLALPFGTWRFSAVPEAGRGRRRDAGRCGLSALGGLCAGLALAGGLALLG